LPGNYVRSWHEDAERQLRHSGLWSYIVRDPTGMILSHGRCRTREACERRAIKHAGEHAEEQWILCKVNRKPWPLDGWRFVIWPPCAKAGHANSNAWRLSKPQINVLLLCLEHKLSRYWTGWFCDDREVEMDPNRMCSVAAINSFGSADFLTPTSSIRVSPVRSSKV
jgi:hypothetical protein